MRTRLGFGASGLLGSVVVRKFVWTERRGRTGTRSFEKL